nr:hypothetical protein [uncultured Oscillibacter sp.]
MGIFQRVRDTIARLMYGRNGWDQLNQALFISYLGLWIMELVLGAMLKSQIVNSVLEGLLFVLMLLIFYRTFSKNLYKRRAENQKWVNFFWGFKSRRRNAAARRADKDHRYFTCKNCRTVCRVPVGKGKIVITCPKCGGQINAKT